MVTNSWSTSITNVYPNHIEIRGYDIGELIGTVSFAEQIFLTITGELPDKRTTKMFEALLCAAIDHGAGTPSALAARTAISGGAALNGAAATGLLTMGDHHGAAVEKCMIILHELTEKENKEKTLEEVISERIEEFIKEGKFFPGIGHRVHKVDPRVVKLRKLADEYDFLGKYFSCVDLISEKLSEKKGKSIPVNIDGVIAAILCEINFPIHFGNVVFMISRIVGVFTQAAEEKMVQKPMRRIDPLNIDYIGVSRRNIKKVS